MFETSNANIDLIPIQDKHGKSVRNSLPSSIPHAQILAFLMICSSFTFRLNTHLTEIQASCFFQFSSSFNLSVIAWFSISVYILVYFYGRRNFKGCHISIKVNLFDTVVAKFYVPLVVVFPFALLDLETIFANFKSLLYFCQKWTI